jgi:hypothetical protein
MTPDKYFQDLAAPIYGSLNNKTAGRASIDLLSKSRASAAFGQGDLTVRAAATAVTPAVSPRQTGSPDPNGMQDGSGRHGLLDS